MKYPTMFKPLYVLLAAVLLAMLAHAAQAGSSYYIDPTQTDLVHILAPPPARNSDEGKADLAAVLAAQASRTDVEVKSAQADYEASVFRFANVMGPEFRAENLPFATTFFRMYIPTIAKLSPRRKHTSIVRARLWPNMM